MRSRFVFIFTMLIVVAFATFMLTFSVRFTEVGVVTTFGKASEESVIREAGLKFRFPYPVQRVTKYDTRVRLLQTRSETQQTADNRQIVAEAFLTWRVSDPLRFYQRFGGAGSDARDHYRSAERTLENLLRSAMSEVSGYRFEELFDPSGTRLGDLERSVKSRLERAGEDDRSIADYGVECVFVGINRIVLPADTTEAVFDRMKAQRDRLAAEAQSRGEALAQTIANDAESSAARIRAFAQQRAQQIRVQGEIEASQYYAQLNQAKDLAIYIDQLEFMKSLFAKRATLILSTKQMGLGVFSPDALAEVNSAGVPPFSAQPAAERRPQ